MRNATNLLSLVALAGLLLGGCERTVEPLTGPKSIRVTFNEAAADVLGTHEEPLAFSHESTGFRIDIAVLGYDDEVMADFDGEVSLRVKPGTVTTPHPATVEIRSGVVSGVYVEVKKSFGPTRIWVEDTEREGASWATGVSPLLRFEDPTVAQTQAPTGDDLSALVDNHVEIRTEGRELIVTHVASDGFYVSDMTDFPEPYGHTFAFSFSRPRDLEAGDKLSSLDGNVDEYLAFTELSFPSWLVESAGNDLPEPITVTAEQICGGTAEMEKLESAYVRVENVQTRFVDSEDCTDYVEYGQWPVQLIVEGAPCSPVELNVTSTYTVPGLRFEECLEDALPAARNFEFLQGMLRNNYAAEPEWILELRGCEDLPVEDWPEDCVEESAAARAHFSGPQPVPPQYRRSIPYCEGVPYELD
jgi:hypothetical protein